MTQKKSPLRTELTGTRIHCVEVTPVTTTSAYADGDSIGGLQTLANATPGDEQSSELTKITLISVGAVEPDMTLMFFDEAPSGTFTDNGALAISDAEMVDKFLGSVEINTADWTTQNTGQATLNINTNNMPVVAKADGSIFVAVMSDATPTLSSVADLTFKYFFRYGS